eukprot:4293776-Ditylum_brightwellii.AAC.1
MYGRVGKWTVQFGDGLCDLLWAKGFSCYCAVNVGNNGIRRRGQTAIRAVDGRRGLSAVAGYGI